MSDLEVKIVKLEPMHVASAHGFGESPEGDAWEKLFAWAKPKGLFDHPEQHRIFGFNNPDPTPGSPNYGYEFWIVVGPDVEPEGEVKVKDFPGGLYAVTRCQGVSNIGPTWKQLVAWTEDSKYKSSHHQWLEEHVGPAEESPNEDTFTLDLYMPIAE